MNESFQDRLLRLMADKGINAYRLARAIGVSPQTVSNWLNGGGIDDERATRLGNFFQVDWFELKHGEPHQPGGDEADSLTNDERQLLRAFRELDARGRKALLGVAKVLKGLEG